jgi:tripartite-type tricarboxylate transporter receptor subunit TctC
MPAEATKRIHAETIRFLQRSDIKVRLVDQGVEMIEQTPDQFRDFIRQEIERYRDIIVRANIQAQ